MQSRNAVLHAWTVDVGHHRWLWLWNIDSWYTQTKSAFDVTCITRVFVPLYYTVMFTVVCRPAAVPAVVTHKIT